MKKLLAPIDREFRQVLETVNIQSSLDIVLLDKSLIERTKNSNWSKIELSGCRKPQYAEI